MRNSKYLFLLLIVPILVLFMNRSFSYPYEGEIKSVEIESNNYPEPGSWHIDKSAEWTGFGKAKVTFDVSSVIKTVDVRYKDVIFVMDISGSMGGSKIERAKADAIELTNSLLSDSNNRIALISFDTTSEVISGFTNNKNEMVNYITSLTDKGSTNYNAGLLNVDIVMDNYVKEDNKDLVLLFLTDGYPNEDTPNQKASYKILKDKYPYMIINGIQYEMGKKVIKEIADISDNQFIADQDTLKNVLFDATVAPIIYENFVITDYINDDYFDIESEDDIVVPFGNVTIENENGLKKVVWDLENYYKTGHNAKMTINLKLKEEFHDTKGLYPTNKSETIISKLPDEREKTRESELTPVLKNSYDVIYDVNTPNGCTLPLIPTEERFVYQNVTMRQDNLVCPGYLYKGWMIDSNDARDIKMINDETFIMPNHDVTIRAIWTKQDIAKNTDGTVHEKMTLYKVLEKASKEGIYAKEYTGNHQDSMNAAESTKKIYYWHASNTANKNEILDKNNVIFANHCWQMIRTTDTGGVKIIYNGEVEDGKCLNTRGNHIGYNGRTTTNLSGIYYYGTDYVYEDNSFKLSGTINSQEINNTNAQMAIESLYGKYTCKSIYENGTCSILYMVDNYYNGTTAYMIKIDNNSYYSRYGVLPFNRNSDSLAYAGYMYNDLYINKTNISYKSILDSQASRINGFYSDEIDYGNISEGEYTLINPHYLQGGGYSVYSQLPGKYITSSFKADGTYSSSRTAEYILKVEYSNNGYTYYQKHLVNGDLNTEMYIGDTYEINNDGTYTVKNIDGSAALRVTYSEWYNSSSSTLSNYKNKYVCDGDSSTCDNVWHISFVNNGGFEYWTTEKTYKYGERVEYNDGNYILSGDIQTIWDFGLEYEREKLNTHHYTCLNNSTTCQSIVGFVYAISDNKGLYYVELQDVTNIEEAIINMLSLNTSDKNVNKNDSLIKMVVESWYESNIFDEYDSFVEDTIYCNNRTIDSIGGLSENSIINGTTANWLTFKYRGDLRCKNELDMFSTLNAKARLKYKVGLATYTEVSTLGNNYLQTNSWLMTPSGLYEKNVEMGVEQGYLIVMDKPAHETGGVRPVISLIPGIEYSSGDGSMENPYIIDTTIDY